MACSLTGALACHELQPVCVTAALHTVAALQQASEVAEMTCHSKALSGLLGCSAVCCMQVLSAGQRAPPAEAYVIEVPRRQRIF